MNAPRQALRIERSLFLSLLFFFSFSLYAEETLSVSSDTIFVDPLPSAERLAELSDNEAVITPSPYYASTLSRIVDVLLFNRPVPFQKPFINYRKEPLSKEDFFRKPTLEEQLVPNALEQFLLGRAIDIQTMNRIAIGNPRLLTVGASELNESRIVPLAVGASLAPLPKKEAQIEAPIEELPSFTLARRYWKFNVESLVQFSQNYVSKNWHKGGANNLNLYNRQYVKATYTRDNLSWVNDLEWRLSAYTSEADTISKFRIADDLLRLHSNFGVRAYKELLYYTLDAEVKTSLFTRREENKTEVLSALFSPVNLNVGLGMRFLYEWKSSNYYGRDFKLSVILSPLAYDFRWSYKTDGMDLTRHGFKPGENLYQAIGSTLRMESTFNITSAISWQSRLYYNTSYKRVEVEWDNSIDLAISRFFSTRLMLQLRFDDAVPRTEANPHKLQFNELFSLGFRYVL